MGKIMLSWEEVEIVKKGKMGRSEKREGNHINLETARLKGRGNSMALLIEWLAATV